MIPGPLVGCPDLHSDRRLRPRKRVVAMGLQAILRFCTRSQCSLSARRCSRGDRCSPTVVSCNRAQAPSGVRPRHVSPSKHGSMGIRGPRDSVLPRRALDLPVAVRHAGLATPGPASTAIARSPVLAFRFHRAPRRPLRVLRTADSANAPAANLEEPRHHRAINASAPQRDAGVQCTNVA